MPEEKVIDILCEANRWTQGCYTRIHDDFVTPTQYCMMGAVRTCTGIKNDVDETNLAYYRKLAEVIHAKFPARKGIGTYADTTEQIIIDFNDHEDTTYEDVRSVLLEAGV